MVSLNQVDSAHLSECDWLLVCPTPSLDLLASQCVLRELAEGVEPAGGPDQPDRLLRLGIRPRYQPGSAHADLALRRVLPRCGHQLPGDPSLDLGIVSLTNATPTGVTETLNAEFADIVQFGSIQRPWWDLYQAALASLLQPAGAWWASPHPPTPPQREHWRATPGSTRVPTSGR
jgi:hypothetical protein